MAWIELHQTLPRHPKLMRLAVRLRITRAQAAGHLTFLWLWTMDYAPNGDLSLFGPEEIAGAADFSGDADQFLSALRETGWLDDGDMIHDWHEFGGKLEAAREQNKRRMREAREKEAARAKAAKEAEAKAAADRAAHVQRTEGAQGENVGKCVGLEEITGEERTVEKSTPTPPPPAAPDALLIPDALRTRDFERVWGIWVTARKGMKKPKSWPVLFQAQLEFLARYEAKVAIEIMNASIRNGWQGLFEPKTTNAHSRNTPAGNHGAYRPAVDAGLAARLAGPGDSWAEAEQPPPVG